MRSTFHTYTLRSSFTRSVRRIFSSAILSTRVSRRPWRVLSRTRAASCKLPAINRHSSLTNKYSKTLKHKIQTFFVGFRGRQNMKFNLALGEIQNSVIITGNLLTKIMMIIHLKDIKSVSFDVWSTPAASDSRAATCDTLGCPGLPGSALAPHT